MANDDTHGDLSILEAGAQDAAPTRKKTLADVKILGMRLCPRCKTDAEYVASVRRMVSHPKLMAVLYGASAIVHIGGSLGISYVVVRLMSELMPAESIDDACAGAAVGLIFGALAGYLFVQGGSSFIQMLTIRRGQRTERLMLKFHDELKNAKQDALSTDSVDRQ